MNSVTATQTIELKKKGQNSEGLTPGYFARRDVWDWLFAALPVASAIASFVASDPDLARRTAEQDDEVDALYDQIYRELLTYMMADPGTINRATHLLWTAHNYERIADRITNICERVIFAATGSLEEINVSSR